MGSVPGSVTEQKTAQCLDNTVIGDLDTIDRMLPRTLRLRLGIVGAAERGDK